MVQLLTATATLAQATISTASCSGSTRSVKSIWLGHIVIALPRAVPLSHRLPPSHRSAASRSAHRAASLSRQGVVSLAYGCGIDSCGPADDAPELPDLALFVFCKTSTGYESFSANCVRSMNPSRNPQFSNCLAVSLSAFLSSSVTRLWSRR